MSHLFSHAQTRPQSDDRPRVDPSPLASERVQRKALEIVDDYVRRDLTRGNDGVIPEERPRREGQYFVDVDTHMPHVVALMLGFAIAWVLDAQSLFDGDDIDEYMRVDGEFVPETFYFLPQYSMMEGIRRYQHYVFEK